MRILITGKAGLVGNIAAESLKTKGDEVFAFDRTGLDICEVEAISHLIKDVRPEALINCAAFTDVDAAEDPTSKNKQVNEVAVGNLADACRKSNVKFLTISTDYVFDGEKEGFYDESDEPNPINRYGQAKLRGERIALENNPEAIVVRTGWVFGTGGTNFLCTVPSLIAGRKDFFAINDAFGTPTHAPDLVKVLRRLIDEDAAGLFHATNEGEGTSYAGFVRECAEVLGAQDIRFKEVSDSELNRAAPRPRNSRMRSVNLSGAASVHLKNWKAAVREFCLRSDFV